jgi:hypothetical protein
MFGLFDNCYRVLQRIIFRLDPDYRTKWNERQQAVSEELPFRYFERLLPKAHALRPVYYRWKSGQGASQWHEADGILIFDDHLLVIEVKAGAFTYTSPATDLPAQIESLKNLVVSPARQGSRFVDYLESAPEVPLYDCHHKEVARIKASDFRHVTVLAITLDSFTELAARAQHLREVGVDVGARDVWPLSVDDLRVYADVFDNPLTFLHFVEQRTRAAASDLVDLNDEIDHLGMYLAENNYAQYAAELKGKKNSRLTFDGYRSEIDEYYSAELNGEKPGVPRQKMPDRFKEMLALLATTERPGRSMLASFLLDAAGDHRETLARTIDDQLRDNEKLGRARPFSTYGDHAFTQFTWSPSAMRDAAMAIEHAKVVLVQAKEPSRLLVEIECSADGAITDMHWQEVGLSALSADELDRLKAAAERLELARVGAAKARGKIRPNDPCPCGSGKKYKRCHGRR